MDLGSVIAEVTSHRGSWLRPNPIKSNKNCVHIFSSPPNFGQIVISQDFPYPFRVFNVEDALSHQEHLI